MAKAATAQTTNALWGADWDSVRQEWMLDHSVSLFSHGAYGACPKIVLAKQAELQERLQRNPTGFFRRELLPLLEDARLKAAELCGADPNNFAWVRNVTDGMTVAINALPLGTGDEIVITNHVYPAVKVAVERRCKATGATIVEAHVPLTSDDQELIAAIESKLSTHSKALIIDDIAAPTARVFPVSEIAALAREKNIPMELQSPTPWQANCRCVSRMNCTLNCRLLVLSQAKGMDIC
jgi:isopenicillin-N epimerase